MNIIVELCKKITQAITFLENVTVVKKASGKKCFVYETDTLNNYEENFILEL